MKKNANASRGPGRPIANIVIPRGKFTFAELEAANKVTPLTLRKFLKRDSKLGKKSQVILTPETRNPDSKNGLGRKVFVYQRRAGVTVSVKPAKRKSKTQVAVKIKGIKPSDSGTTEYEKQKAALLTPTAETAPAPAPSPAPATETAPAPAEPVAAPTATAETAAPVAA